MKSAIMVVLGGVIGGVATEILAVNGVVAWVALVMAVTITAVLMGAVGWVELAMHDRKWRKQMEKRKHG